MKYLGVGLIWIGYGIAVTGAALGTHDSTAVAWVGIVGAICAVFATLFTADS